MKSRIFVFLAVILSQLTFGQNNSLTHSVGIYMGYAQQAYRKGVNLQCQYALGVCPHLDVLTSISLLNVFDYSNRFASAGCALSTRDAKMSQATFVDIGVRTYVDFLRICSFKVSLLAGGNVYTQVATSPLGMFGGNVDTKGELTFKVHQKIDLGLYYQYTHLFIPSKIVYSHVHKTGVLLNLKL